MTTALKEKRLHNKYFIPMTIGLFPPITIFLEFSIHSFGLPLLHSSNPILLGLLDGLLASFISSFIIYFFILKPVSKLIQELETSEASLKKSEERFRLILETAQEGFGEMDLNLRITSVNKRLAQMFGLQKEEMIGRNVEELYFPEDILQMRKHYKNRLQGRADSYDQRFRNKAGEAIWHIVSATPILDEKGVLCGSFSMMTDITKRKQTEMALLEANSFIESSLNAIDDIFYAYDLNCKLLKCNNALHRISGYSDEELARMSPLEFFAGEDATLIKKAIETIFIVGYAKQEAKFILKDRRQIPYEFTGSLLRDHQGRIIGFTGTGRDITRRKLAEEELKKSEEKFRTIFEQTVDCVLILKIDDTRGPVIEYANAMAIQMHGYSMEEFVGMPVSDLDSESYKHLIPERTGALKNIGDQIHFETEHVRKDGSVFPVDVFVKLVEIKKGIPRLISIERDLTSHKEVEKEKEIMLSQLMHQEKLASIGTLAFGVAHEINNPLAIIMGNIEIIEEDCKLLQGMNSLETVNTIKNSIVRIATIVNNLRMYARSDNAQMEKIDIHKYIRETVNMVYPIYEKEDVLLEINFLAKDFFVNANVGKFQHVIMNIISNAKDALVSDREGSITITTRNKDHNILIEIADNGTGIPKETIPKIFVPFFTTKETGKGTGLGLSICHTIVKSFGGTINVESDLGSGTIFRITLPLDSNFDHSTC